ncbi:MAG: hypothetical protein KatS3mg129_2294 [Leptospiraceae bacterium]|nr:MAG: hypothetical protein KatS3mg129_2294 [Leptospiraceae bacterium]
MKYKYYFLGLFFILNCIPAPNPESYKTKSFIIIDEYLKMLEREKQKDCLFIGLHESISGTGIIMCFKYYGYNCYDHLFFYDNFKRTSFVSQIYQIGAQFNHCSSPSVNAANKINNLILPAHYYLAISYGTDGPHNNTNFIIERVSSCEETGLTDSSFLNGVSRLATEKEMDFFSSIEGLIAIEDLTGNCQNQLSLTSEQKNWISQLQNNQITRFAICDYGNDDPFLVDCPESLAKPQYFFSGITSW